MGPARGSDLLDVTEEGTGGRLFLLAERVLGRAGWREAGAEGAQGGLEGS